MGSLITLVAGFLTFMVGRLVKNTFLKIFLGGLFPVMLNALLLPLIWVYCYGALEYIYPIQALLLVVGQGFSVYAVGTPTYLQLNKFKVKGASFLQ